MPRNGSFTGEELDLIEKARRRRKDSCKERETEEETTTTLIFFEIETREERRTDLATGKEKKLKCSVSERRNFDRFDETTQFQLCTPMASLIHCAVVYCQSINVSYIIRTPH